MPALPGVSAEHFFGTTVFAVTLREGECVHALALL